MGTSADRPYLDVIYKLCETMKADGSFSPIMKLSKDKITLPGENRFTASGTPRAISRKTRLLWLMKKSRRNRCLLK